jgi:uncharacterized protein YjbI with pentapeptide repeats
LKLLHKLYINGKTEWQHADLHEADLRRADLRRADLSGVDLSGADLSKVIGGHRWIRKN